MVSVLLTACENFLQVKPKAEIVESEFFNTPVGFEDALYGVCSSLNVPDAYGRNLSWGYVDIFGQYYRKESPDDNSKDLMSLDHEKMKLSYGPVWKQLYQSVGYTNNVLKNLDRMDENSMRLYHLYKGEALGLRAFLHFDLLRLFSSQVTLNPNGRGIPYVRNYMAMVTPFGKISEVYRDIIRDLKSSIDLLKEDEEFMVYPRNRKAGDGFRACRELHFNLYAAQATLARVYWMKGDLDSAYVYARKVIDSQKFPLEDKVNMKTFVAGIISNKEAIWGLSSEKLYESVKGSLYDYTIYGTWLPGSDMTALYTVPQEDGNDMRGSNWFRLPKEDNDDTKQIRCMKIVDEERILSATGSSSGNIAGINMIRIPEMYLIAAEALLEKSPKEAQDYFDAFIVSRGLYMYKDRPGKPTLVLADIMKERRKEFAQEGQYFYAMKRMNMDVYVDVLKKTLSGSDKLYTLPVPDEEFEYRDDSEEI